MKAQNQATLDGSPVAQAIIKFMEDKDEYSGTSSELHNKLESVAEALGVSIVRDRAWPKSARWLWKRITEVLSSFAAAGIEAERRRPETGTVIVLRKVPKSNASNASADGYGSGKGETTGIKDKANASGGSNASANASQNPARTADSGITGNIGIRSGEFSGSGEWWPLT